MAVQMVDGKLPHVKWIDLQQDGTLVECAVVKEDGHGNAYFIQLEKLDGIDKQRIAKILLSRNATNYPLWDLMASVTLGNGINALKYFHQLVRVITPEGKILKPSAGKHGVALVDVSAKQVPTVQELELAEQMVEAAEDAGVVTKKTTRRKTTAKRKTTARKTTAKK